jgi:predicted Na+-dependent transporter
MIGSNILPVMAFHPLQLFACSVLAGRYVRSARDLHSIKQPASPNLDVAQPTP